MIKLTRKKEFIVSLRVSFETPIGVKAATESEAKRIAKSEFKKKFDKFNKELDDIASLDIEIDFVEDAE